MNLRRGFFRMWLVFSAFFVVAAAAVVFEDVKKEFDEAARALKDDRAELARATQQLGLLEEGTRKEEIAQARAALAEPLATVERAGEGVRAALRAEGRL